LKRAQVVREDGKVIIFIDHGRDKFD